MYNVVFHVTCMGQFAGVVAGFASETTPVEAGNTSGLHRIYHHSCIATFLTTFVLSSQGSGCSFYIINVSEVLTLRLILIRRI